MPRRTKSTKIDTRSARSKLVQRREPYWARIAQGCALGYRKGKSGGTWVARWQSSDGRKNYRALGKADDILEADNAGVHSYDQAQDRARAWFKQLARSKAGVDDGLTVQAVTEDYLDFLRRERAASTVYDTDKRVARYILPVLGPRCVADLTTVQIRNWRDGLVSSELDADDQRRAKDTANRVLTILKAALNRAWRDGRVTDDAAWRRVGPFERVGESRKVFLSQAEGQRLVNACHDSALRHLVTAGLLTGARLGELTAARVADVDLDEGIWTVRAGKTGRRDVFLTTEALPLFEQLCAGRAKTQHIFLRSDGTPWAKGQHNHYFAQAVDRAGLDPATNYYSLRHSYVSHALKSGIQMQLLAENIGTSVRMIEKHYGKFSRDDRRRLLEAASMQVSVLDHNIKRL